MSARRLIRLAALAAVASCASASGAPQAMRPGADQIHIDVLNHNFSDATVWAVARESKRRRLGVVTGKTDESYVLDWDFVQPLRLEIDLLAGPRCLTRAITADPGDILQLEIQAVFRETDWCQSG